MYGKSTVTVSICTISQSHIVEKKIYQEELRFLCLRKNDVERNILFEKDQFICKSRLNVEWKGPVGELITHIGHWVHVSVKDGSVTIKSAHYGAFAHVLRHFRDILHDLIQIRSEAISTSTMIQTIEKGRKLTHQRSKILNGKIDVRLDTMLSEFGDFTFAFDKIRSKTDEI